MDDKEFLKLAAKAAGIGLKFSADESVSPRLEKTWTSWNPLTDDGDALRLSGRRCLGDAAQGRLFQSAHPAADPVRENRRP